MSSKEGEVANARRALLLRQEIQSLDERIAGLEADREEHASVIKALESLPGNRKCHRRVGGVLVETNVEEAISAVKLNLESFERSIQSLGEARQKKDADLLRLEQEDGPTAQDL